MRRLEPYDRQRDRKAEVKAEVVEARLCSPLWGGGEGTGHAGGVARCHGKHGL